MKAVTEYSECPGPTKFHSRSSFGDYCLYCDRVMEAEEAKPSVSDFELEQALDLALRVRPTEQDRPRVQVLRLDPDIDAHRDDEEP